jgi:hypothetical protein
MKEHIGAHAADQNKDDHGRGDPHHTRVVFFNVLFFNILFVKVCHRSLHAEEVVRCAHSDGALPSMRAREAYAKLTARAQASAILQCCLSL